MIKYMIMCLLLVSTTIDTAEVQTKGTHKKTRNALAKYDIIRIPDTPRTTQVWDVHPLTGVTESVRVKLTVEVWKMCICVIVR